MASESSHSTDLQKINNTMMKLNTGKHKLNDMMMMADTNVSWDQFIAPAPTSIAYLSQLMLLSCNKDFSLVAARPENGFLHINHPNSFRATLVQLSGAGYKAFNKADANMLEIMLLTSNVSDHIQNAAKCIIMGTHQDIESTMPLILRKIDRVATQCQALSKEIADKFENVGDLIQEIYQTCIDKEKRNTDELEEQDTTLKIISIEKENYEKHLKEAEGDYNELVENLKSSEVQCKKALDEMPSGWEIIGMQVVTTITTTVCNAVDTFTSLGMNQLANQNTSVSSDNSQQANIDSSQIDEEKLKAENEKRIHKEMPEICYYIGKLSVYGNSKEKQPNESDMKDIQAIKQYCERKLEVLKDPKYNQNDAAFSYHNICERSLKCCNKILNIGNNLKANEKDEDINNIKEEAKRMCEAATIIKIQADACLGNKLLNSASPSQSKSMPQYCNNSSASNCVDSIIKNSQYKVEQTKQHMEDARKAKNDQYKIKQEASEKCLKLLKEMQLANVKKLDLEDIKKTLEQGIKQMANLQKNWKLLMTFFTRISTIIKATISAHLDDYSKMIEAEAKLALKDGAYTMSQFKRDSIFEQAFNCCAIAYFVNRIAKTYHEVSEHHIMGPVCELDKLVTYDPEGQRDVIQMESRKITHQCEKAQEFIQKMVEKSCLEMEEYSEKRINEIDRELKSILPPLETKQVEVIKKATAEADAKEMDNNLNNCYSNFAFI